MPTDNRHRDKGVEGSEGKRANLAIELTPNQIDQVVRGATGAGSMSVLLSGRIDGQRILELLSELLEDPSVSRSLMRGLLVLAVLPADEGSMGVVEIAHRLNMTASTTHRYLSTLVLVGLAERNASSRKYRRAE
jgi:IclR helix-turn-helix domain